MKLPLISAALGRKSGRKDSLGATAMPAGSAVPHSFFPNYPDKIERGDFKDRVFDDLNSHRRELENCDLSYSIFRRGYFRDAIFRNCTFKGARFEGCTFRGAQFYRCDFTYASFNDTIISPKEIIPNLPQQPNQKRELLQILRANAQSVGDYEAQSYYVLEEIAASRDHLRRIVENKESYYQQKYGQPGVRVLAWLRLWGLRFDHALWGSGERPWALLRSGLLTIALLAIINMVGVDAAHSSLNFSNIFGSISYCTRTFLDLRVTDAYQGFDLVDFILVTARYLYFGLFVSVLFKYFSHR